MDNIWLLIINPNAGKGKGKIHFEKISLLLKNANISFETVFTNYKNHASEIVEEYIKKGFRKIIIAGGDGSVNEVVNGILSQNEIHTSDITIAVIPIGTGNDWIRTHNIPKNISDAVSLIKKGETFVQDSGKISYWEKDVEKHLYFINNSGMGFGAYVVEETNNHKGGSRGRFLYLTYLIKCLINFKPINFTIKFDDETFQGNLFSICAGIGKYNGGGMMPLPESVADDGLFDITVFPDISKFEVIYHLKKLYSGRIYSFKKIKNFRSKKIIIESDFLCRAEADGELLGTGPFTLEIIPNSIRLIK